MRNIPPDLLAKIKKQNQTIYENADPRMSIRVSRAKTTITDSTYWTVETIRTKEGLGDLSVVARRFKPYGGPNRLYNIYVDNGIVKTAIREYPDYRGEKWQTQFELGQGSAVAIAFDGHWEWYRKKWQPVTVEDPFIFWVDNSKKLWVQIWDEESTKYELSTNVNKVKALRGWKNVNIKHNDQGVVAAYIKTDGSVYYRNYCVQENGLVVWENERELEEFTGVAVNLNLFITNDYRMGIIVQDNQNGIWLCITDRNWAGMGIPAEKFNIRATATLNLLEVLYRRPKHDHTFTLRAAAEIAFLFGRTDNTIVELINVAETRLDEELESYEDYGFRIKVRLNYETMEVPTFSLTDATTLSNIPIGSVSIAEAGYEFIIHIDESLWEFGINNVAGDINISISNFTNEAGYNYDNINSSFTPINLVPTSIPLPEVEAIYNE